MAEITNTQGLSTENARKKKLRWRLHSAVSARRRLAQLINDFRMDPEADVSKFRAMVYGLRSLLDYFAHERELEVEARLEALEKTVMELRKGGRLEILREN